MEGSQYLQRLLRHYAAIDAVLRAAVDGPHAGPFAELDLYLTASDPVELLPPQGGAAFTGVTKKGAEAVTEDGLTIRIHLNRPAPAGAQVIVDRGAAPAGEAAAALPDLTDNAARFWRDLYQAAAAIGREQPFTAHGRLEACRAGLVSLYRLALRPADPGAGWEGVEAIPGADRVLQPLTEWLVCPVSPLAQWRCANHLAEAYEKLMLPLAERLGLPYPWPMRNLAFRRLDEIRPDRSRTPEGGVPRLRDTLSEPDPQPPRTGPARFKVKLRREPE